MHLLLKTSRRENMVGQVANSIHGVTTRCRSRATVSAVSWNAAFPSMTQCLPAIS